MKVGELRLMLAELDAAENVGFADGEGGYYVAQGAQFVQDAHDPECDCGCISICLI